jgi:kinesin family protein C2/C3
VKQYRHLNERYHLMSEENRQLYNTVQDLRGSIRVFCRVRPRGTTGDAGASMVEVSWDCDLDILNRTAVI